MIAARQRFASTRCLAMATSGRGLALSGSVTAISTICERASLGRPGFSQQRGQAEIPGDRKWSAQRGRLGQLFDLSALAGRSIGGKHEEQEGRTSGDRHDREHERSAHDEGNPLAQAQMRFKETDANPNRPAQTAATSRGGHFVLDLSFPCRPPLPIFYLSAPTPSREIPSMPTLPGNAVKDFRRTFALLGGTCGRAGLAHP
jgi:hypothetical protein